MNKIFVAFLGTVFCTVLADDARAALFDVTGVVTTPTGAFSALTPPDTPVAGVVDIDFVGGLAGISNINSVDTNIGGFCASTGSDASECPLGGSYIPITSIDTAALTFTPGQNVGGTLIFTVFSPTFNAFGLIALDLDAGTFFGDGGALGTVSGTIKVSPQVVPIPAAAWLFASALAGLGFTKRRKS